MGIAVGICGAGDFAQHFIPLFQAHPGVEEVSLAETVPERRRAAAARFGIERTFAALEELLAADVEAVAIFTQHHLHGAHAVQALRAGKHVYSAVPMATSLEDIAAIVELADLGKCVYMMAETSFYYPTAMLCRQRFARGDFGDVVYAEGEYLHDMSQGLYEVYRRRHGEEWRAMASIPPMYYPSHSFSLILSVLAAEVSRLSCFGYRDPGRDGIFDASLSRWANELSNETALCELSNGTVARVNEMRRVGSPSAERLSVVGSEATFEEGGGRAFWMTRTGTVEDVTDCLAFVQPLSRLPAEYERLPNGHHGSHQFLVDDFVLACLKGETPVLGARVAASYCAPGLVAHRSAQLGSAVLDVPSFLGSSLEATGT